MLRRGGGTRTSGFTLLEALAALALAAILAGAGVTQVAELVASVRLASGARTVATLLRVARGRALRDNAGVQVVFDAAHATCDMREDAALLATHTLPPGVGFAALPVRGRILFGALGTAENGTIRLAAGARTRSVIVNQRGRVRLQ